MAVKCSSISSDDNTRKTRSSDLTTPTYQKIKWFTSATVEKPLNCTDNLKKKKHHAPIPTVQWLIYPMQHQFSKIINGKINTSISVALKSSWRTDCRAETAVYIILEIYNIRPSNNAIIFSSKKTKNHPNPSNLVYMNSKAIDQITTIPFPTCKIIIIPRKPNKTG